MLKKGREIAKWLHDVNGTIMKKIDGPHHQGPGWSVSVVYSRKHLCICVEVEIDDPALKNLAIWRFAGEEKVEFI